MTAEFAGGTSGVLWGAGLRWLDHRFDDTSASAPKVAALTDYQLGGGRPAPTTGAPATTAATFH